MKAYFYRDVLPFMVMVSAEIVTVGVNTIFKAASMKGLSYYVYILYTYAIVTLLLLPVPFFYRRRILLSETLNLPLILRICLLAVIGFLAQIVGTKGIGYTSPTLSSAMSNLKPAFTFILAVIFRLEKLNISSSSTHAKIIGTIVSISGALVVVLYKGPLILSVVAPRAKLTYWVLHSANSEWIIGSVLLATQYILYAFWNIIQTQIMIICPMELLMTFYYTLCVTIISAPICFMVEKDSDAWILRPDITAVAITCSAVFNSGYNTIVHSWGFRVKGPVYVAIFKPLSIGIAAIFGVIFLGDALYLGILIGAVILSTGVYAVIWGKANEEKPSQYNREQFRNEKTPLLQTKV